MIYKCTLILSASPNLERLVHIPTQIFIAMTFSFSFRFCDEGTCKDKANILYAWARNAPPTRLPKGTSESLDILMLICISPKYFLKCTFQQLLAVL